MGAVQMAAHTADGRAFHLRGYGRTMAVTGGWVK